MTPEQKNYLTEHLPYTLQMLRHTHHKVLSLPEGLDRNAYYEAFAVSARNLDRFLTNKDTGNFTVHEFVEDYCLPNRKSVEGIFFQMERQVFHLAKKRPTGITKEKIYTAQIDAFYRWVEAATLSFFNALSPEQRALWPLEVADPNQPNAPVDGPFPAYRTTTVVTQSISPSSRSL